MNGLNQIQITLWKDLMPKTPKTYIHVNQHKIRSTKKHGTDEPVITVKRGSRNDYCHSVEVLGPSVIRYGGNDKPILSCGARVVIETESEVKIIK